MGRAGYGGFAAVFIVAAACDSSDGTGRVSAFACQSDSDCPTDEGPARCVSEKCELLVTSWGGDSGCGADCGSSSGGQSSGGSSGAGASNGGASNGGASNGGASNGGASYGGTCGDGGCALPTGGSLAGTWEIIGSRLGSAQKSALVTVSSGSLLVLCSDRALLALRRGDVFDIGYAPRATSYPGIPGSLQVNFGAQRTDGPGTAGIIPLPLFGDWDAHAPNSPGCTVHAAPDSASATCSQARDLPDWMEKAGVATLSASRTEALPSAFGDFGGVWSLTTGVGASCTIRFEGSTISASCINALDATGSATLTIDGDTAHGSTSKGIEFTARRF